MSEAKDNDDTEVSFVNAQAQRNYAPVRNPNLILTLEPFDMYSPSLKIDTARCEVIEVSNKCNISTQDLQDALLALNKSGKVLVNKNFKLRILVGDVYVTIRVNDLKVNYEGAMNQNDVPFGFLSSNT